MAGEQMAEHAGVVHDAEERHAVHPPRLVVEVVRGPGRHSIGLEPVRLVVFGVALREGLVFILPILLLLLRQAGRGRRMEALLVLPVPPLAVPPLGGALARVLVERAKPCGVQEALGGAHVGLLREARGVLHVRADEALVPLHTEVRERVPHRPGGAPAELLEEHDLRPPRHGERRPRVDLLGAGGGREAPPLPEHNVRVGAGEVVEAVHRPGPVVPAAHRLVAHVEAKARQAEGLLHQLLGLDRVGVVEVRVVAGRCRRPHHRDREVGQLAPPPLNDVERQAVHDRRAIVGVPNPSPLDQRAVAALGGSAGPLPHPAHVCLRLLDLLRQLLQGVGVGERLGPHLLLPPAKTAAPVVAQLPGGDGEPHEHGRGGERQDRPRLHRRVRLREVRRLLPPLLLLLLLLLANLVQRDRLEYGAEPGGLPNPVLEVLVVLDQDEVVVDVPVGHADGRGVRKAEFGGNRRLERAEDGAFLGPERNLELLCLPLPDDFHPLARADRLHCPSRGRG
mmetsp:Transcript_27010/g.65627  ORF Transcript_27010/g.65627 Transcript_27010/m.65627 type:complete len:508 (+) Transcript_27010:885-2408(+)